MSAIAILSGKGGVGKTTTAINLGHALNRFGGRAAVLEANLTAPNLHLHLGGIEFPTTFNDVLKGKNTIMQAVYQHACGLPIIPGSMDLHGLEDLDIEKGKAAIRDLKEYFDTIIIDGAAGLGREAHFALELADEALIVTTPDLPSVSGAVRVISAAKALRKTPLGIVLTGVLDWPYELSDSSITELTGLPIISKIPYNKEIKEASVRKYPALHIFPKASASKEYLSLGHKLLVTKRKADMAKGGLFRILRHRVVK